MARLEFNSISIRNNQILESHLTNLVKTDKAQVLAEKYTGYRLPSSATSKNNLNNETDSQNIETPSANPSSESNESKQ